jgi:hypothetical protein
VTEIPAAGVHPRNEEHSLAVDGVQVAGVTQNFYIPNNAGASATPPSLLLPIMPTPLGRVSTWTGGFVGTRF